MSDLVKQYEKKMQQNYETYLNELKKNMNPDTIMVGKISGSVIRIVTYLVTEEYKKTTHTQTFVLDASKVCNDDKCEGREKNTMCKKAHSLCELYFDDEEIDDEIWERFHKVNRALFLSKPIDRLKEGKLRYFHNAFSTRIKFLEGHERTLYVISKRELFQEKCVFRPTVTSDIEKYRIKEKHNTYSDLDDHIDMGERSCPVCDKEENGWEDNCKCFDGWCMICEKCNVILNDDEDPDNRFHAIDPTDKRRVSQAPTWDIFNDINGR